LQKPMIVFSGGRSRRTVHPR